MKADWVFLRLVAYCVGGSAALAYYPLSAFAAPDVIESAVAGGVAGFLNLTLGYVAIELGFRKSNTTFLKIVLGGMTVRLLLMWAALAIMLKFYQYHDTSLMFTLLYMYLLTLVLEIYYLQKRVIVKS
ncbi:MAG: hypothetical protein HY562_08480 [Ignavibacteriales bacterium]|nr:hypothetical protein [Ignavibacteriales bacterium]